MKSEVEEIVEDLPEDADLMIDPGHSEQLLLTQDSQDESEVTPPSSTTPPSESHVGPEPVLIPAPAEFSEDPAKPEATTPPTPEATTPPTPEATTPTPTVEPPPPERVDSPLPEIVSPIRTPVSDVTSPVLESDQESSRGGSKADRHEETSSLSSDISAPSAPEEKGASHKYATLSRVRKFRVDGQVIESTTKKIVDVTANKTLLRDNKRYQQMR